jgi:hypothetical protein
MRTSLAIILFIMVGAASISSAAKVSMRYRRIVSQIAGSLTAFQICHSGVNAQIPMMEDYGVGSGTVVRKDNGAKEATNDGGKLTVSGMSGNFLQKKLKTIESLTKEKNWDAVLAETKKLKEVNVPYFGYKTRGDFMSANAVSPDVAEKVEAAREGLSFDLRQVADIALDSRVVFFNSEDLKGIAQLQDETGSVIDDSDAIKESLTLLSTLAREVSDIDALLKK